MATARGATVTLTQRQQGAKTSPSSVPDVKIEDVPAAGKDDFFWAYTEEPHRTRRQAIIKAHPEVTKLCGHEPLTKYVVFGVVLLQLACAYYLRNEPILSFRFLGIAYVVGATANQNLFLAIHEISHNLAFRAPVLNRALAIFANLPVAIPYSASFRPYHLTHHKSLGIDGVDVDLPTSVEAVFLDSVLGKAFFCTFQIFFYALRPMFYFRLPVTPVQIANIAVQFTFDALLVWSLGFRPLVYLLLSSFLAGSLHPCAGHFIAEHYIFQREALKPTTPPPSSKGAALAERTPTPETYSYYGPLNFLTYNVGLHNEHHDFPAVPWTRLYKLHATAPEFYECLPCHRSWVLVLWQFVVDPRVGLWYRVKRAQAGRCVGVKPRIAGLAPEDQGE